MTSAMKNALIFAICLFSLSKLNAQDEPMPWKPPGADTTFPRSIIHRTELDSVRSSLELGRNIDLYQEIYQNAISIPSSDNDGSRLPRADQAKNAAFVLLLGVKPVGSTTVDLDPTEMSSLKSTAIKLLEEMNTYIHPLTLDSPTNFDYWQWNAREIIEFLSAYDMLKGAGVPDSELVASKLKMKTYVGTLYDYTTRGIAGQSFFQGAKNNHALMSASAIGMGGVILADLEDTEAIYQPTNWINVAMWNIHNVMWWDIKKQSMPAKNGGYAEGTYYFRYAFVDMLPFFRAIGFYLKDTVLEYSFINIHRKIRNPWYDTNYIQIYDWYASIRFPDGRMPPLEDSYTYKGFPELAILRKQKYVWPMYLSQMEPLQDNSYSKNLTSIYDMRANFVAANLTPMAITSDSLFKVMPNAGIAVFRTSWDSSATYMALCGKNGSTLTSADAHNHADDASFIMMVNGQMMAIDPGYINYIFRYKIADAPSHNMILINGKATDQGFPGKPNGANAYLEKHFSSAAQNYAEVRTAYQGARINRKILQIRNKYFFLVDHMQADTSVEFSWLLHGYGSRLFNADASHTGLFTNFTSSNRAAWKRKNSGLFAYINSDRPFNIIISDTGLHEYIYDSVNFHTYITAKSQPVDRMSFITSLQPYKNLATDTIPLTTINLPDGIAYKIEEGLFTDMIFTKSLADTTFISKAKTDWVNNKSEIVTVNINMG